MYFFPDGHTIDFSTSITTCCIVASLQQFVVVSLCCVSLRHDDMKFIAASFFSLKPLMRSSKEKKAKEKRSHYSVIDWAKRIKRQLMENIIKCSYPKMTGQNDRPDESLTGQVHDQAGHCPYFEPCRNALSPVSWTGIWNTQSEIEDHGEKSGNLANLSYWS